MPDRSPSRSIRLLEVLSLRGALAVAVFVGGAGLAEAQLVVRNAVNPPYTPEALIRDVFLGDGVEIVSVTYDGASSALGYFEQGTGPVGLSKGLVLTTGEAQTSPGTFGADAFSNENAQHDNASTVRDPNLEQIVPYFQPGTMSPNILNVARYTITFVPKGDRVSFRYAFASEEYPQFVCSEYNDVFGFFISGPGFSGPYQNGGVNIAVVPGTTLPVTINSINGGVVGVSGAPAYCTGSSGSLGNSAFYRDNSAAGQYPVYNGLTRVLTAEATVQPCQTYIIQITIGDVRDAAYDSGVFLEAKSFSASKIDVDLATPSLGNEMAEGCDPAVVTLGFNDVSAVDRWIPFTSSGTAQPGVDYAPLPDSVRVPAGQRSVSFNVFALVDGIAEAAETIVLSVKTDPCTTSSLTLNLVDRTIVPVPSLRDTTVCPGAPVQLRSKLPLAVDTPRTFKNNTPLAVITHDIRNYRDLVVSGVTPDILNAGALARVCIDYTHARPEDLDIFLFSPAGKAVELTTDNGGLAAGTGVMCFTLDAATRVDDPTNVLPLNGDYRPEGNWSDILGAGDPINGTWRLQVTDDQNGRFGSIRNWSITFKPKYTLDYRWVPAAGLSCANCPDPVATPASTTTYTVEVRDSYGCMESRSVKIAVFAPSVAPVISCTPGFDNVRFEWPADANALRYETSVDGGPFQDIGSLRSQTVGGLGLNQSVAIEVRAVGHCQTVSGSGSCTTQNCPVLTQTGVTSDASCGGYADGTISVSAGGGVGPYRFILGTDTSTTGQFTNLRAGTYEVLVLDANACRGRETYVLSEPPPMTVSVSQVGPAACGAPVQAMATAFGGGGAPYAYSWSDGQTGPVASFGASGTFYLTVRDGSGCDAIDSAVVAYPAPLIGTFAVAPISCAGAADGRVTVSGSGGVGPYEYSLDGVPHASAAFGGLAAGTPYLVRVIDATGCSADTTITLASPLPLSITFDIQDLACFGDGSGRVRATVINARGPVVFAWAGRSTTTEVITGLSAGDYALTVRDSAGCRATANATVRQPDRLSAAAAVDSVACNGGNTGRILVSTRGGTAPFTFNLNGAPAQNDSAFVNLSVGSYRVDIFDAGGCEAAVTTFVAEPRPLSAFHQLSPVSCAGESDAAIDLTVEGGTTPYSYTWGDGAASEDRTGLAAARYSVTATDAKGCRLTYEVTVDDPLSIELGAMQINASCFGYRDASISLNATGGRPPYDFSWTGPNGYAFFGPKPAKIAAGTYVLELRDSYGCGKDTTFVVTQPATIGLTTVVRDTICFGASDGTATVRVSGGTAPFQYRWSSSETDTLARRLPAGLARVQVTDAKGCIFRDSAVVPALEKLSIRLSQDPVACYRDSNGRAQVTSLAYGSRSAGLASFSYTWRGYRDSTRSILSNLGGRQEVFVTAVDTRGCSVTDSIAVGEPAPMVATASLLQEVSCHGGADGSVRASVAGGNAPYSFTWTGSAVTNDVNATLPAGLANVRVTDARGCVDTTSIIVRQPDSLSVTLTPMQVNCFAINSGSVVAAAAGGNVPYSYDWTHGPSTNRLDSLRAGTYTLVLRDAKGCSREDSVTIVRDVAVEIVTDAVDATCAGETDGSIEVVASGGQGPYLYRIRGEAYNRFGDFRFLAPGVYVVEAKDRNGCPSAAESVTVDEPQALIVDAGGSFEVELGDSLQLAARVFNAIGEVSFQWLPRDSAMFSCPGCPVTFVRPRHQGTVRVLATDGRGCEAQGVVQLRVRKTVLILVPTGFTPNDDGRDDLLLVHGRSGTRVRSFQVFNRWGELVHEATDFAVNADSGGWDGSYRERRAPAGVYIWKVEAEFVDGSAEVITGQTTLIR